MTKTLAHVHRQIRECRDCPEMCGTPVHGPEVDSPIWLLGQAPGPHEAKLGRPFAYTAGRTLFKWFAENMGIDESAFRDNVYIAAVARCFPGKAARGGGDREPNAREIENCRRHLEQEAKILRPRLVIAVGRLAITESLGPAVFKKGTPLADVVGKTFTSRYLGLDVDVIPLPHPSGISSWPRMEPGKTLLKQAFQEIRQHRSWISHFRKWSSSLSKDPVQP